MKDLVVPAQAQPGATIDVAATVVNRGTITASPAVSFHLGVTPDVAITDHLLTLSLPALTFEPGQSIRVEEQVVVPSNLADGVFYVGAVAPIDPAEQTPENNSASVALSITGGAACTPDAFEPDDAVDQAGTLTMVGPQVHNFCDDDRDLMSFEATAGTTYTFLTYDEEDNASVVLRVIDPSGAELEPVSVGDGLRTWSAPADGQYHLLARPVGGLLGTGALTGYSLVLGDDRPDIVFSSMYSLNADVGVGDVFWVDPGFTLRGLSDPGGVTLGVYLSTDSTITAADRLLRSVGVATSNMGFVQIPVPVPQDLPPGPYYFGVIADPDDTIAELVETNNTSVPGTLQVSAWQTCTPDSYEPDDLHETTHPLVMGQPEVHNLCDDEHDWFRFDATAGREYRIRFDHSTSFFIELELADAPGQTIVSPQASRLSWVAPNTAPYFVHVTGESNTTYDPRGGTDEYTIALLPPTADLTPTKVNAFQGPLYINGNNPVDVEVTNLGGATASGFTLNLYLSTYPGVTTADTLLISSPATTVDWSSPGRVSGWQLTVPISSAIAPGSYYLGLIVDPTNVVTELDEQNNTLVVPITVQ